jgi:hypothetical protein
MNPLEILLRVRVVSGPLTLFLAEREVDRDSAWFCLGLFAVIAVAWFFLRRTWLGLPLAILGILGWLWVGIVSLGPVQVWAARA